MQKIYSYVTKDTDATITLCVCKCMTYLLVQRLGIEYTVGFWRRDSRLDLEAVEEDGINNYHMLAHFLKKRVK